MRDLNSPDREAREELLNAVPSPDDDCRAERRAKIMPVICEPEYCYVCAKPLTHYFRQLCDNCRHLCDECRAKAEGQSDG